MTDINELTEIIRNLSPDLQREVEQYLLDLQEKERSKDIRNQFKLDWRGALRDVEGDISSVDLQHQIWKDQEE